MNPHGMSYKFEDDDLKTRTVDEQRKVEKLVESCFACYESQNIENMDCPVILRDSHVAYLLKCLVNLPSSYESLDSSGPWIAFWTVHSLEILRESIPEDICDRLISFLKLCQSTSGGFGGGPGQMPHLATTYAAVMTLCILKKERAYKIIDRPALCNFYKNCRQPDGSFLVHDGGEADIRGSYCAMAIARLIHLPFDLAFGQNFTSACSIWLEKCQTYEGGFGACPGCEAHGGYTFCGVAAALLLSDPTEGDCGAVYRPPFNVDRLLKWISYRQMAFEGGFQGRTNKLVDSCYSYWQGATFPLLNVILRKMGRYHAPQNCMFETQALENYLLICCQMHNGGLVDKPGKRRDLYHTCYALSGLAIARQISQNTPKEPKLNENCDFSNIDTLDMAEIDPLYNISTEAVRAAWAYFLENPAEYDFSH